MKNRPNSKLENGAQTASPTSILDTKMRNVFTECAHVENAVFENQKRKFEIYVFSYKKWNTALFQRETTQHGLHARAIVVRVWFKLNRDENEVGVFFRKVGNRIIMVNNHFGEFQTPPKVLKKDHFGE